MAIEREGKRNRTGNVAGPLRSKRRPGRSTRLSAHAEAAGCNVAASPSCRLKLEDLSCVPGQYFLLFGMAVLG